MDEAGLRMKPGHAMWLPLSVGTVHYATPFSPCMNKTMYGHDSLHLIFEAMNGEAHVYQYEFTATDLLCMATTFESQYVCLA